MRTHFGVKGPYRETQAATSAATKALVLAISQVAKAEGRFNLGTTARLIATAASWSLPACCSETNNEVNVVVQGAIW
jgi:hypothetical protein